MSKNIINDKIGIIGAGRLGSALALALNKIGSLEWIIARDANKAERLAQIIPNALIKYSLQDIEILPEIILIAVDDKNIEKISYDLKNIFGARLKDKLIGHLSGSKSLEPLKALEPNGANIFAAHPCQTFYYYREDLFNGIYWGLDCPNSLIQVSAFIVSIGGIPYPLPESALKNKPLYHLSAVFASNFVNTAIYFAGETAKKAGIEPNIYFKRLIETTVENALKSLELGKKTPLTGPISRGDSEAIMRHISTLENISETQEAYKHFSSASLIMAEKEGLISSEAAIEIKKSLG